MKTMGPSKQSKSSNPIYPFVILPSYRLLVTKHNDIALECRRRLVEQVKAIPNLLQDQAKLQLPRILIEPISCLAAPRLDGLKCRKCGHMFRQTQKMRLHCTEEHLWKSPRGRGRPISGLEPSAELPWIEGVACQRFFPSREGSRWFEVLQDTGKSKKAKIPAKSSRPDLRKDVRSLNHEARAHLSDVLEREENYVDRMNQPRTSAKDLGSDALASTGLCQRELNGGSPMRTLDIGARTQSVTPVVPSYAGSRVRSFMSIAKLHSVLWRRRAAKLDIGYLRNIFLHSLSDFIGCRMLCKEKWRMFGYNTVLSARLERLWSHRVWDMFDVSRGLWPDLGNYLCVKEISVALNEGRPNSAEDEDEERTGEKDEDDFDIEGEEDNEGDGDWDSEDDEIDHDDSGYGSDQADFSREADGELDIAAFDEFQ
ncbi:hypothetical protein HZ326_28082 [Fusarium oxysporum f. sp. albedinis]|nr:hypothetical protein HZ326_28082 [Fusarium oxysporum f. sp. albedinis]